MKFLNKIFENKPKKIDLSQRFEVIGRVGQGSMSRVFRVRDTMTGKIVALKVLDLVKTRRFESRFVGLNKPSEGEVAVRLNHPNIVRTFEYGSTLKDEQFLVMEFVEGVGLSLLVDTQNETMQKHRLRLMVELGEAIAYFHRENWIHRDICPRNVLLDQDYHIKLIDFGLVVPNTPDFKKPGNRTGTVNYMAPELIKRQATTQQIDIFSFAVTCYEMLTKSLPWQSGETLETVLRHINQPPVELRERVPDIDEQVSNAIMRGLKSSPRDRWPTVQAMIKELREADRRINGTVYVADEDGYIELGDEVFANSPEPYNEKVTISGSVGDAFSGLEDVPADETAEPAATSSTPAKGKKSDSKSDVDTVRAAKPAKAVSPEDSELDKIFDEVFSQPIEAEPAAAKKPRHWKPDAEPSDDDYEEVALADDDDEYEEADVVDDD